MNSAQISIRQARGADGAELHKVAARDAASVPAEPLLVAEADGEVVAALSLATGATIADPFRHTAEAVAMLRLRAGERAGDRSRPRGGLRARFRSAPAPA